MINIQEYINQKYPTAEDKTNCQLLNIGVKEGSLKGNIRNLNGIEEILEGSLSLKGFTNLKELWCNEQQIIDLDLSDCSQLEYLQCWENKLTNIDLSNCQQLKALDCSFNKLNKLDLSKNTKITFLFCNNNELTNLNLYNNKSLIHLKCNDNKISSLDLTNNNQLNQVYCFSNQLTKLDLNNNKIAFFYCFSNQLTSLDFLIKLNPQQLKILSIDDNNFFPCNLRCFSIFTNLEVLGIGKNNFLGSLEPLKNLSKLKWLIISDTNITKGLEYLPDNIDKFDFSISRGSHFTHVNEIKKQMQGYNSLNAWRNDNKVLINQIHQGKEIKEETNQESKNKELKKDWETIHLNFTKELRSRWENKNFTARECKEWIDIGLQPSDADYAKWLRDTKRVDTEWLLNKGDEAQLRKEYESYSISKWHSKDNSDKEQNELLEITTNINEKDTFATFVQEVKEITTESSIKQIILPQTKDNSDKEELIIFLIKKELKEKGEEIEKTSFLKTWFNENCVLVISRKEKRFREKSSYRLWISVYEPAFGKTETSVNLMRVSKKVTPIKESWEEIIESFKKMLDSDYPAATIYNNNYTTDLPPLTQNYKNVVKKEIKISSEFNLENYLKPYDIVKRKIDKTGAIHHYAIYLGNKQVAHISKEKEEKSVRDFRARVDEWKEFLKGAREIEIHHPFIPFKKPELIQEHIDVATKTNYGKGEYKLFGNNCEHFVTLCVYGLDISWQSGMISEVTKNSDYLLQAINESNEFFRILKNKDKTEVNAPKTILLVGSTGSGKSALANVITGTNKFKEGEYGVSETRDIQIEETNIDGICYRIIDTVGLGDTKLTEKEVLKKLSKINNYIKEGLSQVFYFVDSKFTKEKIEIYNVLIKIILGSENDEYSTIIRTKFSGFRKLEKCKEDIKIMSSESKEITKIIKNCNGVIHVNNLNEDDDPELRARTECRKILIDHLKNSCQSVYKLEKQLEEIIVIPPKTRN